MVRYRTVFLTQRAPVHQKLALEAAPLELEMIMLRNASSRELSFHIRTADFLITEREGKIDRRLLEQAHQLKLIVRLGSRTWDIDCRAAYELGIRICTLPIASCIQVAEHVVMQALALARRVRESMSVMQNAQWQDDPVLCTEERFSYNWTERSGINLMHGTVFGILGFGEIGAELAQRLQAFGCTVVYHKRSRLSSSAEQALGITYLAKKELVKKSDFLCSLLPFFDDGSTKMTRDVFQSMKDGAYFLHCGGSGAVPEDLIIEALDSGKLAGAALDTYSWEPMKPDHPILKMAKNPYRNLVLTPHVAAGGTSITQANMRKAYYEDIMRYLKGEPLLRELKKGVS